MDVAAAYPVANVDTLESYASIGCVDSMAVVLDAHGPETTGEHRLGIRSRGVFQGVRPTSVQSSELCVRPRFLRSTSTGYLRLVRSSTMLQTSGAPSQAVPDGAAAGPHGTRQHASLPA